MFLTISSGFCQKPVSFSGLGAGGQVSLVVPEDNNYAGDGVAFGFGIQGMAEFSLGRFGTVQYLPSLTFWFQSDDYYERPNVKIDEREGQITLNFFDVKYLFPLTKIFIKPYTGISPLPCIIINTTFYEINGDEDRDSDVDPCFNIFFGIDFPVNEVFVPYIEWRYTASDEWALRISGGLMFCF